MPFGYFELRLLADSPDVTYSLSDGLIDDFQNTLPCKSLLLFFVFAPKQWNERGDEGKNSEPPVESVL